MWSYHKVASAATASGPDGFTWHSIMESRGFSHLILDVTTSSPEHSSDAAQRCDVNVVVHFYNKSRQRIASLTRHQPELFDHYVQGSYKAKPPTAKSRAWLAKRQLLCSLSISTQCTDYTYGVLVISQKRTSLHTPFEPVETLLSGRVTHQLPSRGGPTAATKPFTVHMGTFTSLFDVTQKAETSREVVDLVAIFLKIIHLKTLRPVWAFHPLGRVLTPQHVNSLDQSLEDMVDSILNNTVEALLSTYLQDSTQLIFLDDFVDELDNMPCQPPNDRIHTSWDKLSSDSNKENLFYSYSYSLDASPQTQDDSQEVDTQERFISHLHSLVMDIKDNTLDISQNLCGNPLSSFDEKKPPGTHSTRRAYKQRHLIDDTTHQTAQALKNLRRVLHDDFLEPNKEKENFTAKNTLIPHTEEKSKVNHQDKVAHNLSMLRTGVQLLQQRQEELEHLLNASSPTLNENQPLSSPPHSLKYGAPHRGNNTFLQDFLEFTRGLERVSQMTGSSFRRLQRALHYPEELENIYQDISYPHVRKLLEFMTTKQATQLVEHIEVLAGVWRSFGGQFGLEDSQSTKPRETYDTQRKPWWPLRPLPFT